MKKINDSWVFAPAAGNVPQQGTITRVPVQPTGLTPGFTSQPWAPVPGLEEEPVKLRANAMRKEKRVFPELEAQFFGEGNHQDERIDWIGLPAIC
jgi:hypothetical protein